MQRTKQTNTKVMTSVVVGTLAVGVAGTDLLAQQIPAIEPGARKVTSRLINGELEIRDNASGKILVARQRVEPMRGWPAGVVTNVRLQEQPTGADIIVEARNTTMLAQKAGQIGVGILNMGENVEQLNSTETSFFVKRRASQMVGWAGNYPDDLYSPAMVLKNDDMAVGVSIQYPIMEYKHDVKVIIDSPGSYMAVGEAGRGWTVRFGLANIGTEAARMYEGEIPAGQTRTYVISVRFTDKPDDWVTTLLPYRNFFRSTYGPVQYSRKTTPVLGFTLADPTLISPSNPHGFHGGLRPDQNGYSRVRQALLRPTGWPSVMLWMPTGLFNENQEQNFPYQVGSQWNRSTQMATALDPTTGLPGVAAGGRELGIWWGRSLLMSRTWNSSDAIHFDPDNAEHREIALRELDGIAATGATLVGLDTYQHEHTPIWKSIPWLQAMRERHPNMSFVTEPAMCDILHTVCPTYVTGFTLFPPNVVTDEKQLYAITGPNVLVDFINPGHETWGSMSYHHHRNKLNRMPTPEKMAEDMRQFAQWGYRPVFFDVQNMPERTSAGPSWETSLPRTIVATDPVIQALKRGRRPNDAVAQQNSSAPASASQPSNSPRQPQASRTSPNLRGIARALRDGVRVTRPEQASTQSSAKKPAQPQKQASAPAKQSPKANEQPAKRGNASERQNRRSGAIRVTREQDR